MTDTIGSRIRTRREELEMSQDELATRLGYKSRSSITKIEKDGRGLPQNKIFEIAAALKTTPSYIMGWEEVQKKNDVIADTVLRMQSDEKFRTAVMYLDKLEPEKLDKVTQLLQVL